MRLIDADELKKYQYRTDWNVPVVDVADIDNEPTITEVTERPKGKWLCDNKYLDCRCSICNSYALERGDYPELSPYCPQCGARMEVITNENND